MVLNRAAFVPSPTRYRADCAQGREDRAEARIVCARTQAVEDDLGRAAGGPVIYCVNISTITDLADEDLRQVAGGPRVYNV